MPKSFFIRFYEVGSLLVVFVHKMLGWNGKMCLQEVQGGNQVKFSSIFFNIDYFSAYRGKLQLKCGRGH